MKTKTLKILTFIVSLMLIVMMTTTIVYAADIPSPSDMEDKITADDTDDILDFGGKIIGILQTVGVVLSVVILTILGIKYMMGSAEEKAEYKKTMIPYLVGAVFIFMAPTIANIVYQFVKD